MNLIIFYSIYSLSHRLDFLDKFIVFIASNFGYFILGIALAFLIYHHDITKSKNPIYVFRKKWREILVVFFSGSIAWIVSEIIKYLFQSPRPFIMLNDVTPLFMHGGMDSFPSGHSAFFMALAVSLFFSHKKIGVLFIFFALLIGLARVASGVHFPIDVLCGFAIGVIVAFFVKTL